MQCYKINDGNRNGFQIEQRIRFLLIFETEEVFKGLIENFQADN